MLVDQFSGEYCGFEDLQTIEKQAFFFYKGLFNSYPSKKIVANYIKAHLELPELKNFDKCELASISFILHRRLNFVGIEPWLRSKKTTRRHALTVKLLLMMYLAECDGDIRIFNRQPISFGSRFYLKLIIAGVRSALMMAHGLAQKKIYGIS